MVAGIEDLVKEIIAGSENSSLQQDGFAIYRNNYLYNHLDMLLENFPVVNTLLGENNFKYFGKLYLELYHPQFANIELFGMEFPLFLSRRKELGNHPEIAEFAKLDWLWATRFYEPRPVEIWEGILQSWNSIFVKDDNYEVNFTPNSIVRISLYTSGGNFLFREELPSSEPS